MCFNVTLLDNRNRLLQITVAYVRVRDFLNESPLSSFLPLPGNLFCCSLLPIKVITLFLCSLCSALPLVSPAVLHTLLNLFVPPFCHLQNGNNNCTYFLGLLCRLNDMPAACTQYNVWQIGKYSDVNSQLLLRIFIMVVMMVIEVILNYKFMYFQMSLFPFHLLKLL